MTAFVTLISRIARALRAMLGVPDYDRYVAHCRACHPGSNPMTRDQFARDRLEWKYARPGNRCC